MSRGPGRIERAIRELFAANPDLAFSVVDLVEHCYPGVTEPEKKHTVSVIRAARRVVEKDPDWTLGHSGRQGGALVFSNQANLQSHCLGWLMEDPYSDYRDRASLLAELAAGRHDSLIEAQKKYVDLHIAERDGDPRLEEMKSELSADLERVLGKGWILERVLGKD